MTSIILWLGGNCPPRPLHGWSNKSNESSLLCIPDAVIWFPLPRKLQGLDQSEQRNESHVLLAERYTQTMAATSEKGVEEKLIFLVENHGMTYNKSNPNYRDTDLKENVWISISE